MHLHSTQKGKFHNVHEEKILYGTYCVSGVRATILLYGHTMYIATDRPLARILLLLLLYKKVLDLPFPAVATIHLKLRSDIP